MEIIMKSNKKKKNKGQLLLHLFFIILCGAYILPFILIISVSFTEEAALKAGGFSLLPKVFSTAAYQLAFKKPDQLINSYVTTIICAVVTTVAGILFQGMLAYALSRPNYKLRKFITFLVFFAMLFSGGLVPSYIIKTKYLHLNDTIWVYILPSIISTWNLIVLRSNFRSVPSSLIESAKVDGANEWRICFQIVYPLSVPSLAAIGFLQFVGKWNDWFTASIYVRKPNLYSLQFLLQRILRDMEFLKQQMNDGNEWLASKSSLPTESFRFAMAILAAGPVLVIFPLFQKYFSKGLTVGGVKG